MDMSGKVSYNGVFLLLFRLVRQPKREGLIQARLRGASEAEGEVLTFLDAHCECAPHWLEPMLQRIAEDPTRVETPVIENIDMGTFGVQITQARNVYKGIFNWNLGFNWAPVHDPFKPYNPADNSVPVKSPTMAGGLFTMKKSYFNYLGTYDGEMKIWGGENIEMSFRVSMDTKL